MGFTVAPSVEDISSIAESIVDDLPRELHKHVNKLKVQVEDFPDAFVEQEMELETPFDILGCYQSAGPAAVGTMAKNLKRQDTLFLYRRPILDAWAETGEDLARIVNRVIIQEIGHHFGFSQGEIEMYEEDAFGATATNEGTG